MQSLLHDALWVARCMFTVGAVVFFTLIATTLAQCFWLCLREGANDNFEPKYRHFLMSRMALITWILVAVDVCLVVMFVLAMTLPGNPG